MFKSVASVSFFSYNEPRPLKYLNCTHRPFKGPISNSKDTYKVLSFSEIGTVYKFTGIERYTESDVHPSRCTGEYLI